MPVDVVFVRDPISWNKEFKSWEGIVGHHMIKIVEATESTARVEAPHPGGPPHGRTGINYSTGELASGITSDRDHTVGGDLEGRIIAIPEHALILHKGAAPHVIRPRRAPRLVFFWHKVGRVVSFSKVNHPGIREDPFLTRALEKVMTVFR